MLQNLVFLPVLIQLLFLSSSKNILPDNVLNTNTVDDPTAEQKAYWYNNEAEISSYELSQARYGEVHEGRAVLIFVTEHYSPSKKTKPDAYTKDQKPVLKLNFTKKFNTGIYPYSMMTSTFYPFDQSQHSYKITSSSQEWCGHTYMEMVNNKKFDVSIDSYFENESEQLSVPKAMLEDDIWSAIRIDPAALSVGSIEMIPSFFYLRMKHRPVKALNAVAELVVDANEEINTYSIFYPLEKRKLEIDFEKSFPHRIMSWREEYRSGWGANKKKLVTTATLKKTIMSDYWNHNGNKDLPLRAVLGLD